MFLEEDGLPVEVSDGGEYGEGPPYHFLFSVNGSSSYDVSSNECVYKGVNGYIISVLFIFKYMLIYAITISFVKYRGFLLYIFKCIFYIKYVL